MKSSANPYTASVCQGQEGSLRKQRVRPVDIGQTDYLSFPLAREAKVPAKQSPVNMLRAILMLLRKSG